MAQPRSWIDEVTDARVELGGVAPLAAIYDRICDRTFWTSQSTRIRIQRFATRFKRIRAIRKFTTKREASISFTRLLGSGRGCGGFAQW